jgi:hypothetical protein
MAAGAVRRGEATEYFLLATGREVPVSYLTIQAKTIDDLAYSSDDFLNFRHESHRL